MCVHKSIFQLYREKSIGLPGSIVQLGCQTSSRVTVPFVEVDKVTFNLSLCFSLVPSTTHTHVYTLVYYYFDHTLLFCIYKVWCVGTLALLNYVMVGFRIKRKATLSCHLKTEIKCVVYIGWLT